MKTVIFQSNPDKPLEYSHKGRYSEMSAESRRSFSNLDAAMLFWKECDFPVTTMDELLGDNYEPATMQELLNFKIQV